MLDITGLFDESLEAIRASKYSYSSEYCDQDSSRKDFDYDDTQLKDSRRHFKIILNNRPPKYSPSADLINNDDQKLDIKTLLDIMVASDELVLQDLIDQIQNHFIYFPTDQLISYLIPLIATSYNYPSFEKLLHHIIKTLYYDPSLLLRQNDLSLLQQPMLLWILEEIHHLLDDEDIWGCIINWGISQHSSLMNTNLMDWSKLEFSILNETIYPFLKFIKFSHISRNYFIENIVPYLLHFKEIDNDTIRYYLNTTSIDSQQSFLISLHDSTLINHTHTSFIADWIDKGKAIISAPKPKKLSNRFLFPFFKRRNNSKINSTSPLKKIRYNFDLLFRMTRDGPSAYLDRCLKQVPTLVIAKVRCSSKTFIVGGYNPVGFNYSYNNVDISSLSQTFIFSFGNGEGLEKLTMIRVQTDWSRMAIKFFSVGLCFGYDDLTINFKERNCEFSKYFLEYDTAELLECEVFQVLES
ncbi:19190_t:CDS:2 [Gigaspora margarita]|uniref:19190_t:CDS:1 n=1 Tax=Gigaspora margarita TaxID=4874 RepID=A0ABN7VSZ7_GIGMA|nr:19190_t:CDS:2 [Gigaspora margarita]